MADPLDQIDPEKAENMPEIEKQWAVKAVHHAQVYWKLITSMRGSQLKLTPMDDEIREDALRAFPELKDPARAGTIDEEAMKSPQGKKAWREFMMPYEKKIADYNYGTLMRTGAAEDYTESTTIFVPRMQFYAIEILRNKYGLNDPLYENAQREAAEGVEKDT